MVRALMTFLLTAYSISRAQPTSDELLGRIRQHLQAEIAGLPNYTCQETMDRSVRDPSGKIDFQERLRLAVLVTAKGELFAWPGSTEFEMAPLDKWIAAGAISTGNFAVELRNLFLTSAATLTYKDMETGDHQTLYRFSFQIPLLSSRHTLLVSGTTGMTAISGSIWVSADSLDIVRLETNAEEIPSYLDCREEHELITYGRVRLSGVGRLIPTGADLALTHRDGSRSHNSIAFSKCQHFSTEASISFAAPTAKKVAKQGAVRPMNNAVNLPAGIALILRLEEPISIEESAAGDQVAAKLDKAVKGVGVSLPKG